MKSWEDKAGAIEAVRRLARKNLESGQVADLLNFVDAFYRPSTPEDITSVSPEFLYAVALSMWRLAERRVPGKPNVRVFNARPKVDGWQTPHTVIQIINDDMPFLVDSITGLLTSKRHFGIHIMHHPLMVVRRGKKGRRIETGSVAELEARGAGPRESCIYIEIDAQSDAAVLEGLEREIESVLADVRLAVEDWRPMLVKIEETITSLGEFPPPIDEQDITETLEFLNWLTQDNFTLIGYREYRFKGDPKIADFRAVPGSGLGTLRDSKRQILRGPKGLTAISEEIRDFLSQPDPIIITKANVKTQVHRPIHLDYIGVKIFNERREVVGERRFVGLFTSQAYSRPTHSVPILRRRIRNVQRRALFDPTGHGGKALSHILENFPRDELFQISEDQLLDFSLTILGLMERPRPRALIRRDKFERFVSALVYVPRDRYHSELREAAADILCRAFNGEVSAYYALLSEDVLARWHFIIRTRPGEVPDPDPAEIDRQLANAAKGWTEHLHETLIQRHGEAEGNRRFHLYGNVFSEAYKEAFQPHQASHDISRLEEISADDDVRFEVYRLLLDPPNALRLKIFHGSRLVPLSDCLPKLEHLGLSVISEHAYELIGRRGGVQDFYLENAYEGAINVEEVKPLLHELLPRIWDGRIEDDGLNALSIQAGFSWREVMVLRAYAKYLRQIGLPFSQDYIEECIALNPGIARMLLSYFRIKFDPEWGAFDEREDAASAIYKDIRQALDAVASLDQDRILRAYAGTLGATIRTNFYQPEFMAAADRSDGELALALKFLSEKLPEAPRPRPYVEIFVYSPRLEGVHLRGGPVARGGLRWSDRPEDFRTEVLGLVKAQQVKNAVIVPVGAKGGFVPKRLPPPADRKAYLAEGTTCYRTFVTSLLSLTDDLKGGRVMHPDSTVRWDGDDPYLVVAADKGTATFSDTANSIAEARRFWLGDAFASGGSVGYDHKKMGITARGAWVSVQRHFRELGKDIQKEPFDVIGIGDMSGDVFGNGMLLSKTIRLKAAFDHRHIFFDPEPDPARGFRERRRLFKKPRSSWADYNVELISEGGGVFDRGVKSIKLSAAFKDFLGTDEEDLAPAKVIHLILKAKADLLWIGGIGTYVKGAGERNADVGDRANDLLRVNGEDLRVKVVGEGGNLGLTQRGRIEFARRGGRLNTDFIDNSAGVDCSDKEVNIKILLADCLESGVLEREQRSALLASMTDDVAEIVLADNYLQTQAISLAESQAARDREQHLGLIRVLERDGRLDREIENLPSDDDFSELAIAQKGLTRPELATLTAHAKMMLEEVLVEGKLIDNAALRPELLVSFPAVLRQRFAEQIDRHRLHREIIATTLANEVVNRAGLTFVFDVKEETGLSIDQIMAAFVIVRDVFGLDDIWPAIDALDYRTEARSQMALHIEIGRFLRRQVVWFLRNSAQALDIEVLKERYSKGVARLLRSPRKVLSPLETEAFEIKVVNLRNQGVPTDLAHRVCALEALGAACDIVHVAEILGRPVLDAALAYFEVGRLAGLDWLRRAAEMIKIEDHWDQLAVTSIIEDLADQQRELTRAILEAGNKVKAGGKAGAKTGNGDPLAAVRRWSEAESPTLVRAERLISDLKAAGSLSVAKLSFAVRHLRSILPVNL